MDKSGTERGRGKERRHRVSHDVSNSSSRHGVRDNSRGGPGDESGGRSEAESGATSKRGSQVRSGGASKGGSGNTAKGGTEVRSQGTVKSKENYESGDTSKGALLTRSRVESGSGTRDRSQVGTQAGSGTTSKLGSRGRSGGKLHDGSQDVLTKITRGSSKNGPQTESCTILGGVPPSESRRKSKAGSKIRSGSRSRGEAKGKASGTSGDGSMTGSRIVSGNRPQCVSREGSGGGSQGEAKCKPGGTSKRGSGCRSVDGSLTGSRRSRRVSGVESKGTPQGAAAGTTQCGSQGRSRVKSKGGSEGESLPVSRNRLGSAGKDELRNRSESKSQGGSQDVSKTITQGSSKYGLKTKSREASGSASRSESRSSSKLGSQHRSKAESQASARSGTQGRPRGVSKDEAKDISGNTPGGESLTGLGSGLRYRTGGGLKDRSRKVSDSKRQGGSQGGSQGKIENEAKYASGGKSKSRLGDSSGTDSFTELRAGLGSRAAGGSRNGSEKGSRSASGDGSKGSSRKASRIPSLGGSLTGSRVRSGRGAVGPIAESVWMESMESMLKKNPDDLVINMTSDQCFPSTKYLLGLSEMSDDMIAVVVKVLARACHSTITRTNLFKLLSLLPNSTFFRKHLSAYLNRLPDEPELADPGKITDALQSIITLFMALLTGIPSSYPRLPIAQLYLCTDNLVKRGELTDNDIETSVKELMKLKNEKVEEVKTKEESRNIVQKQECRRPGNDADLLDEEEPPNDFRWLSIIPTQEDIETTQKPFLRRNKVDGRYTDPEHYLDVQFRLLREDFIRPLRNGISDLLDRLGSAAKLGVLQDIRVYQEVRILYPLFTPKGLLYKISFGVSRMKRVNWKNTKRLMYGSLLCLSKDNFESFILATVENSDERELSNGKVDVHFINHPAYEVNPSNEVYVMVEPTSYFEAYRHVLEGLKEIEPHSMPFQKYLVQCNEHVDAPAYLRKPVGERVAYDLSPILKEGGLKRHRIKRSEKVDILNMDAWPSAKDLGLDNSQLRAIQMALSKEFAVIQGPPGTGKTFIGLKVVKALLHNKSHWNSIDRRPILVVCYTNHALDQFLEGIHEFHPEGIVRVGGRSQSEAMQKCSLRELKNEMHKNKEAPITIRRGFYNIHTDLEMITRSVEDATHSLKKCMENVLHEDELFNTHGCMTQEQYDSLLKPLIDSYTGMKLVDQSAMLYWLGLLGNVFEQTQMAASEGMPKEEEKEEKDFSVPGDVIHETDALQAIGIHDPDDVTFFGSRSERTHDQLAEPLSNPQPGTAHPLQDAGGWQIQKSKHLKRKTMKMITRELGSQDMMTDEETRDVMDIWNLTPPDKWRLYRRWIQDLRERHHHKIAMYQEEFERGIKRLNELRRQEDLIILKKATVIGMTTTGAAKFRSLIQKIRPCITIAEEAAEVLESHIVTSLSPECQHLILIGDHQQLRPNPTVYRLAKDYHLDVSLFERMVTNGVPFERLRAQHRMRPEIARMLDHIYTDLEDHESVLHFENIKGVATNVFFIDHNEKEESFDEGKSHSNTHEAKFLAALCCYFILQGYKPEHITILTMYSGQLIQLKNKMAEEIFKGVRVCTVDNFQGEENDIILLSLVRSNEDGKIGFLRTSNRVCVALSRARKGFFLIGNLSLMAEKEKLWKAIIDEMHSKGKVGNLILTCQIHPKNIIRASRAEDFHNAPEGGCLEVCNTRLECKHVCTMPCHPTDLEHIMKYCCKKKCNRMLCDKGHQCEKLCYQDCGPCMVLVPKSIPSCKHIQQVPCSVGPEYFRCMEKVDKKLLCGHVKNVECHVNPKQIACMEPCRQTLKCEHECAGTCSTCSQGRLHTHCTSKCNMTLLCGHLCQEPCTMDCPQKCEHRKCMKKCGAPCVPCRKPCAWECPHYKCLKFCCEPCERERCNKPCELKLKCGHPCIGLCGEPCPKTCRACNEAELTEILFGKETDPAARFVELEDCSHVIEVEAMDQWMDRKEKAAEKGEKVDIQLKRCPKCKAPIRASLRYGNIVKTILADFEELKMKMMISPQKQKQAANRLTAELREIEDEFPRQAMVFKGNLAQDSMTVNKLNTLEYHINFMKFLSRLMLKIKKDLEPHCSREKSEEYKVRDLVKELKREVHKLQVWTLSYRVHFSEQELEDINEELPRVLLLVSYKILDMQIRVRGKALRPTDSVEMQHVRDALELGQPIDDTCTYGQDTMLNKQPRAEATQKRQQRMTVIDVPPSAPDTYNREYHMKILDRISKQYLPDVRVTSVTWRLRGR